MFGINLGDALEQIDRKCEIVIVRSLYGGIENVVGRLLGTKTGRPGRFVVECNTLGLVSLDRPPKRRIIVASVVRDLGHQHLKRSTGDKLTTIEFVAGVVFRVVALDVNANR